MGGTGHITYFSLPYQKVEGPEGFLLGDLEIGPVKKVDIDMVCPEAPEALFTAFDDVMPGVA